MLYLVSVVLLALLSFPVQCVIHFQRCWFGEPKRQITLIYFTTLKYCRVSIQNRQCTETGCRPPSLSYEEQAAYMETSASRTRIWSGPEIASKCGRNPTKHAPWSSLLFPDNGENACGLRLQCLFFSGLTDLFRM